MCSSDLGTIRRRSASRRSGRVGVCPQQRGRTGVCGSRGEGALASFTLVEGGLGCREKSVVTAAQDQGIIVTK